MENTKLTIEELYIGDLTPYERNAKLHPEEQVEQIKRSIQEFGMNDPIGVWGKKNLIVEGHGRYLACKQLGIEYVPVIRLDHMTDEQRKEYTLVHNKTTMNSDFDYDILFDELKELKEADNFDFNFYGFDMDVGELGETVEDNYDIDEPLQTETRSRSGQVYQLGEHRLMVGDSTSESDVESLIGRDVYFDGGDLVDAETEESIGAYFEWEGENAAADFFDELGDYEESEFYESVKAADELTVQNAKANDDINAQRKCMEIISNDRHLKENVEYEIKKEMREDIEYINSHYRGSTKTRYLDNKKADWDDLKNAVNSENMDRIWELDTVVRDVFWRAIEKTAKSYGSKKKK